MINSKFLSEIFTQEKSFSDIPKKDVNLFLELADEHGMTTLLYQAWKNDAKWKGVPEVFKREFKVASNILAISQVLRKNEWDKVSEALDKAGVGSLLLKGFPLAYTYYEYPWLRPSLDTDILIEEKNTEAVNRIMDSLGYYSLNAVQGQLITNQFSRYRDENGTRHVYDFHFKISNPAIFSEFLTFEEVAEKAIDVPALGPYSKMPCLEHMLLIALIHRVAHHHNDEKLVWLYDIYLLARELNERKFAAFWHMAAEKKMTHVCEEGLRLAKLHFGLNCADLVLVNDETSATYLRPGNILRKNFLFNLKYLPGLGSKLTYLKNYAFPPLDYMLNKYKIKHRFFLPWYYFKRGYQGIRNFFN